MFNSKSKSIVSHLSTSEITARSRGIRFHPKNPAMYFNHFNPSTKAEIDVNGTDYYHNQFDYSDFNKIHLQTLKEELRMNDHNDTPYGSPFRMMNFEGNYRPAYIPLLSDLDGYLHKGVRHFIKWLSLQQSPLEPELIPEQVIPIFDLRFDVNPNHIVDYALPTAPREIFMGAYHAGVHVMVVTQLISQISFKIWSRQTNRRGHRYFRTTIESETANKFSCQSTFSKGSRIVIWNARDVHRPSFAENFGIIHDSYSPLLLIVTKARAWKPMLKFVQSELKGNYRVEVVGPNCGLGGVMCFWAKGASPYFSCRKNTLYGEVLSANIIPSKQLNDIGRETYCRGVCE